MSDSRLPALQPAAETEGELALSELRGQIAAVRAKIQVVRAARELNPDAQDVAFAAYARS